MRQSLGNRWLGVWLASALTVAGGGINMAPGEPPTADKVAQPIPRVVAHRGLLRHAPENTLANFRACLALGLGFEFDVQRCRDGALVCLHDDTVERTTSGRGKVAELTLAELRQLDAGRWFAPEFAGQRVPTITEVLELAAAEGQPGLLLAADLKAAGVEGEVAQLAGKLGLLGQVLFIGRTISEPAVRRTLRETAPQAQIAAVTNRPEEFAQALAERDANWVYFRYLPTREELLAVQAAKKRSFIAGVTVAGNLPENWRRARAAGIDALLTDYPLELREVLRHSDRSDPVAETQARP